MSLKIAGLAAALLTCTALPAAATGVTPGTVSDGVNIGVIGLGPLNSPDPGDHFLGHYDGPGAHSASVALPGLGTTVGTLNLTNSPTPGIVSSLKITAPVNGGGLGDINDVSIYYFQILGAPGTAKVHVDALGAIGFNSVSSYPLDYGTAEALFRVEPALGGDLLVDQSILMAGSASGYVDYSHPHDPAGPSLSFTVNDDLMFNTNEVYKVTLLTDLKGSETGAGVLDMYANVDPTFTVAGPFSLQVSPGFGGVVLGSTGDGGLGGGAVPEPGVWAMLLLGFAGIGAAVRAQRRTLATAGLAAA